MGDEMVIGLSWAEGVYAVKVDSMKVANVLTEISELSESDELEHWGGILQGEELEEELEDTDGEIEVVATVTLKQAMAVKRELCSARETLTDEEFEDLFLDKWSALGLR